MKKMKMMVLFFLLAGGTAFIANGQSYDWQMVLNHDTAPFKIKMTNNEMTFCFNPESDTLFFSPGNKKPMKGNFIIEVVIKNNNKLVYTSSDKNLSSDKMMIIVPLSDIYAALKTIKVPSKAKYLLSIKDRTVVKEKFLFEFPENK